MGTTCWSNVLPGPVLAGTVPPAHPLACCLWPSASHPRESRNIVSPAASGGATMKPGQAIVAVLYWLGERANGDKTNERGMRGATA
jgi:hypothetical protein